MPSNTARIAKNTLLLYFRQILIMLVSLYTVRVVLETLGVEDYGIFNIVAGIITMFSFFSSSMATASQRYFSFELGRGDFEQLKKVFSLSLLIYMLIGVLVIFLAETIGLWFVNNKLVIPLERKGAALWVYQFSIISFFFTVLTSPYLAMIIAREDMYIYTYVSIVETILKLVVVFILRFIQWDKLALYGLLMLVVVIINTSIYRIICIRKYKECKFSFFWNKELFKEIISFFGWNIFGASAGMFKNQLVNILLNQFFNPVVVAARSIATQVDTAVMSFSQNFNKAMRPQLIEKYAAGEKESMFSLMFRGIKISYLLMYIVALPLILEMPMVLKLWLKNPPEYAILFTRLMMIDVLIASISYPILAVVQATGKIKLYQAVVGGILLLNLPVSWIVLQMGAPAYFVLIVAIILCVFTVIARLFILKSLVDYSIKQCLKNVFLPVFITSIIAAVLPTIVCYYLSQTVLRLFIVTGLSVISVVLCSFLICLGKEERQKVKNTIFKYVSSKKIKNNAILTNQK